MSRRRVSERTGREPLTERIMVRMSTTTRDALKAEAAARGSDESSVGREYILAGLAQRARRRAA